MRSTSHRAFLTCLVALAALALVASGCGSGSSSTPSGDDSGGSADSTLTIAVPSDVTGLDPAFVIDDQTHELVTNVYDVGVGLGEKKAANGATISTSEDLQPRAFTSWKVSPDGKTYTIKLRKGMTFQDGSPVTADDVVYTLDRLLNTESGGTWAMQNIVKVTKPPKATGKYELEMHADAPSVLATQMFFTDTFAILQESDIKSHATKSDPWAKKWLATNIANTSGPYLLKSHLKDQEVVFVANPKYWGGKPAYTKVVWKIVPSAAERVSLLQAGAVDMATGLTPQQIATLKNAPGIKISDAPTYRATAMGMNNATEPFNDVKVRQAVSYAVDYDDIIKNVYQGSAQRSAGPVPTGTPYALPVEQGYQTDLVKAKQLLQESGYDGQPVTLSFNNAVAQHQDIAVRVKSQLAKIGMKVNIQPLNNAVFDEQLNGKKLQMWLRDLLAWIPDPNYILDVFFKCDNFANYSNYCNKDVDKAIAAGWSITDHDKRYALFADAQKKVIADAPWVWIGQANFQVAMRDSVDGFVTPQNLIPTYDNMHPAK